MSTNTEIKTAMPQKYHVDSHGSHYPTSDGSFYFADEIEPLIAELRAALEKSAEELEEWRFTNKVDELQRENERFRVALEAANHRIEDLTTAANRCINDALGMASAAQKGDDEPSAREQKLAERVNWNTKQWYEHVGAWENEHDQIVFGSVMALHAMMMQFQAVTLYAATQRAGSGEAKQHSAVAKYQVGNWFDAHTIDEMQDFYLSRLPAIRAAAREHGYAIGVHGSMRRDFDLMAMQWRDGASDKDSLTRAIADAACGIRREGSYDWESKPNGRIATSLPICWTDHANPDFYDMVSAGHIDLSIIVQPDNERDAALKKAVHVWWIGKRPCAWDEQKHAENYGVNCQGDAEYALAAMAAQQNNKGG